MELPPGDLDCVGVKNTGLSVEDELHVELFLALVVHHGVRAGPPFAEKNGF